MQSSSDKEQQITELHVELMKAREERGQAQRELEETKWRVLASANDKTTIEILEAELDDARDSEKRMLASLAWQTKQLEQIKMSLEEAKLEIASLHDTIETMQSSPDAAKGSPGDAAGKRLRAELKHALAAEEKSKKAMDDFVLALKEVTTESNTTRQMLARAQFELDATRLEADRLRATLKRKDDKLRCSWDEVSRLKAEAEETFSAWRAKEAGFTNCMKATEEELADAKHEIGRFLESQRAARDEISKLRDILKQAIKDSNVVKEALEIARSENAQLKDVIAEKDSAMKCTTQELETLKVSEAAALDSVKELQSLLVATSSLSIDKNGNATFVECSSPRPPPRPLMKYPSELRELSHSFCDSDRFTGSIFDLIGSPEGRRNGRGHAKGMYFDVVDGMDSPSRQKRRPQIMRKVGGLLRWRSFHK